MHWGVGCAMLHGERLRSKASLTGRCFWWRSRIPKPAVTFPVWSPHIRATVENAYLELTAHYRPGAQRREQRSGLKECARGWQVRAGAGNGNSKLPTLWLFSWPHPFSHPFCREKKRQKVQREERDCLKQCESGAELAMHPDAPRGLEPL